MSSKSAGRQPSKHMPLHINRQLGATPALQARALVTMTRSLVISNCMTELQERAKQAQSELGFTRLDVELRGAVGWLLLRNRTVRYDAVPWTSYLTSSVARIDSGKHSMARLELRANLPGSDGSGASTAQELPIVAHRLEPGSLGLVFLRNLRACSSFSVHGVLTEQVLLVATVPGRRATGRCLRCTLPPATAFGPRPEVVAGLRAAGGCLLGTLPLATAFGPRLEVVAGRSAGHGLHCTLSLDPALVMFSVSRREPLHPGGVARSRVCPDPGLASAPPPQAAGIPSTPFPNVLMAATQHCSMLLPPCWGYV